MRGMIAGNRSRENPRQRWDNDITYRENDIADSEQYVCYDGSSKHNGGGQASILQRHLGSDIINLAETLIFVGRIVHILWPKRPWNEGRFGQKLWPKRILAETSRYPVEYTWGIPIVECRMISLRLMLYFLNTHLLKKSDQIMADEYSKVPIIAHGVIKCSSGNVRCVSIT